MAGVSLSPSYVPEQSESCLKDKSKPQSLRIWNNSSDFTFFFVQSLFTKIQKKSQSLISCKHMLSCYYGNLDKGELTFGQRVGNIP